MREHGDSAAQRHLVRAPNRLRAVQNDLASIIMIEFPNPLEIVLTREFAAPIELVFDVLTKPEHIRETFAPFGETVTACTADLRVGGGYHYVFVTSDGMECSFRGTFLEIERRRGLLKRGSSTVGRMSR